MNDCWGRSRGTGAYGVQAQGLTPAGLTLMGLMECRGRLQKASMHAHPVCCSVLPCTELILGRDAEWWTRPLRTLEGSNGGFGECVSL